MLKHVFVESVLVQLDPSGPLYSTVGSFHRTAMYILPDLSPGNPETIGVCSKTGTIQTSPSVPRGHLELRSPMEEPLTAKLGGLIIHGVWQT